MAVITCKLTLFLSLVQFFRDGSIHDVAIILLMSAYIVIWFPLPPQTNFLLQLFQLVFMISISDSYFVYRGIVLVLGLCNSGMTEFSFSRSAAVNSETRQEVAIKKIGNTFDNIVDAKRTLREIKLLRFMDHENVSRVLSVCFSVYYPYIHCQGD